jgi:hypothetical protein
MLAARLTAHPVFDGKRRSRPHQLRQNIGVEENHSPKVGGLRMDPLGTSGNSTPPRGANRARITAARFAGGARS